MPNNIYFKHICGIEFHGLSSQEVQKLLDATKGDILEDFWIALSSEWIRNDPDEKRARAETYTIRIGERRNRLETDESYDSDEIAQWHSKMTTKLENIVKLIEEALA